MFNAALSRVAPTVAAKLAEQLFVTPVPARRPVRESSWAEGADRGVIPSPLGPIPVWLWSNGGRREGTVVLVHGWSGRGLQLGAFVEPLVANGFRVVTHDAPGHGEARGRTSSMPAFAAAVGAVAGRFGPVSAVVTHSLGSAATIYALGQRELSVERIVAISPSARLDAIRDRFGALTGFAPAVIDQMRKALADRLGFDWETSEPLRLAPTIPVPLMVIHDAQDRFIPHREGADLAERWPDGRLFTTTGLGHHRILRDPEVVSSVVAFISETAAHGNNPRRVS